MTKAESTFETSVDIHQSMQRNNPEDSHLHTHQPDNLNLHSLCSETGQLKDHYFEMQRRGMLQGLTDLKLY
jgi:hypothetical protein